MHEQEDYARNLPHHFAHQPRAKGKRRSSAIGNPIHLRAPRPCGCQNLGLPGGGSTWISGRNRRGTVSRMRARTQPLTAKMQDSLGNRLRYLPAVTLAAAGRSGSVSGVSVTRQGWHMALTGSEETSTTDGVSDVSLPHTSSLQSNRYVRRILPTNFPRGFRCSDFKSNCTDSSSSNSFTFV